MRSSLTLVAMLGFGLAGTAHANLVTNGSFETVAGGTPASFEFGASYKYANGLTGWSSPAANAFNVLFNAATASTVSADTRFTSVEPQHLVSAYKGASPDGGNFVALDGDTNVNGALQQTIGGLTAGAKYDLSFYWAATQYSDRSGDTTEKLQVSFGRQTQTTAIVSNPSQKFQGWFSQTFTFTADASSDLLSFLSIGTPNGYPPVALLDGVSLVRSPVPEPATLALLGGSLAMFGIAARRLRR